MTATREQIVLTEGLPDEGLEAGDVGVVVFVHAGGEAYEVEFLTLGRATVAVATARADQVRPLAGVARTSRTRASTSRTRPGRHGTAPAR